MVEEKTLTRKKVACLSHYLLSSKIHKKNHAYLTDSQQIFHIIIGEILLPTTFVTEWTSIGYCKTSDFFFWLIFLEAAPRWGAFGCERWVY